MTAPHPTAPRPFRRVIWPLLRPYKWTLLAATALNALHGIAIAFQTLLPKYVIDDVVLAEGISSGTRWTRLAALVGLYLFVSLVWRMLLWHVSYRMFTRVRERLVFGLRRLFFAHVNHLCLRFHRQTHSGELFSYLFGSPLAMVVGFYNHFATSVPGAVFTLVWTLAWVAVWDWAMTLVLAASIFSTVILMQVSYRKVRRLQEEYQTAEAEVSADVADLLRGTRDVKLHAYEAHTVEHFSDRIGLIGQKSYRRDVRTHIENMRSEGSGYLCFGLLCALGAVRYHQGAISVGEFQAYLTAFIALQWPLNTLFSLAMSYGNAQAGMSRIDRVLRTASTTPDPAAGEEETPVPVAGSIRVRGVTFSYDGVNPVLRDISLNIPHGQHVALVGPSGSGKSTLAQLLLRLYDPDEGTVSIGETDLRRCRGADVRMRFGVVPQDPFLFRTSVRENLKVANPEATDDEIEAACRAANAWGFIWELPEGLETNLAESGASLSGGQRQRLAIARALLKRPDYFLFDEATSALDTNSERSIQQAIENAWHNRTAIIIAHRLSTVKNCDRVVVLRDGRVVQDGTYEELAARPGLFRELVEAQALTGEERTREKA